MAFVKNKYEQISLYDSLAWLTVRQRKMLDRSWAKPFADELFPLIEESRFAPFYSEKSARPNNPVNMVVGALLLEHLLDLSDEELLECILFDVRFQVALHTTGYEAQPFSCNTFRRFRKRNEKYRQKSGEDLLGTCLEELTKKVYENPKLKVLARRRKRKEKKDLQ